MTTVFHLCHSVEKAHCERVDHQARVAPMESKMSESSQHRRTVVWVDCAKMTYCIGFFSPPPFNFSAYIQDAEEAKEGFGEKS